MREIRTSGSVRGEEGNLLPYSTFYVRLVRGTARDVGRQDLRRGPLLLGLTALNKANSCRKSGMTSAVVGKRLC